jgi:hypothetical protein
MMNFAPALVGPALLVVLIQLAVTIITGLMQIKLNRRSMKLGAKLSGLTFASFSGIQKIKLTGAERRIFTKWADAYKQGAELSYNPPSFIKLQSIIAGLISLAGTIILYYSAAVSAVSVADYMAFNASYGMVSGAIMALAGITTTFANIKPLMEMVEPILKEVPETGEAKRTISRLSGNIEINNVSLKILVFIDDELYHFFRFWPWYQCKAVYFYGAVAEACFTEYILKGFAALQLNAKPGYIFSLLNRYLLFRVINLMQLFKAGDSLDNDVRKNRNFFFLK